MSPVAGWYADPDDASRIRYWDGTQWTEQYRALTAPSPAGLVGTSPGPEGEAPGGNRFPVKTAALAGAMVVAAIGGGLWLFARSGSGAPPAPESCCEGVLGDQEQPAEIGQWFRASSRGGDSLEVRIADITVASREESSGGGSPNSRPPGGEAVVVRVEWETQEGMTETALAAAAFNPYTFDPRTGEFSEWQFRYVGNCVDAPYSPGGQHSTVEECIYVIPGELIVLPAGGQRVYYEVDVF